MHCLKKKLSALVLLAFMSAPLLIAVFQLAKQQYIQYQAKQQLETALLETIVIPTGKLHWIKKNKEILVHGNLFDVKHIKKSGGNYIVTGLFDEAETAIVKKMEQAAANNNKTSSLSNTALQFLLLTVFNNPGSHTTTYTPIAIKATLAGHYTKNTCNQPHAVNTPPPNRA